MILEQESFILALPGDIVTIVARFSIKNQITTPNVTVCNVFVGPEDTRCEDEMYPVPCTQRINENIVFIKINDTNDSHKGFYCYSINVSMGGSNYTGRTNNGIQLLILEPGKDLKINQPTEVEFRKPVIINCSFSMQDMISGFSIGNNSVLWSQVYWMVGEPREHFVYHPDRDYIHPEYKGMTELIGQSDLLLEDFHGPDNTTLYCRVAIRFCLGNNDPPNPITTILKEGPGTLLRFYDVINPTTIAEPSNSRVQIIVAASCVGCAVLLFLVLLIICLKTRKDQKRNNSGETVVESIDVFVYQNSAYENIEKFQNQATKTDEKLVYAVVKHSATTTPQKPHVTEDPEVVYAAVKKQ
ncbi:uncharacterized protein LOC142748430 [Rhinoderma darwinii]|uniref:uncharacterized protein LOC142748430 n=1 Tax=Rhinoderma darwinii TaxID=43563 RepID=UPI003F67399E